MRLPPYPVPGDPIRAAWGREVIDYLRSITPQSSEDIFHNRTANGTTSRIRSNTSLGQNRIINFSKPFDLIDIGDDSYSLADNLTTAGGLWLDGKKVDSIDVDGATYETDRWTIEAVAAAQYVYLLRDYSDETTTLTVDSELPDGAFDDEPQQEIMPLWFIDWDPEEDIIEPGGIIDLRGAFRIYTPIPGGDTKNKVLSLDAELKKKWDWVRAHG